MGGYEPISTFKEYVQQKTDKLHHQFDALEKTKDEDIRNLFSGVSVWVNGYTVPSSMEIKRIMAAHGGNYEHFYSKSTVTHIIATMLPDSKIHSIKDELVVKPQWIVDSIANRKLLPVFDYLLYNPSPKQNITKFYSVKRTIAPTRIPNSPNKPNIPKTNSFSNYTDYVANTSVKSANTSTNISTNISFNGNINNPNSANAPAPPQITKNTNNQSKPSDSTNNISHTSLSASVPSFPKPNVTPAKNNVISSNTPSNLTSPQISPTKSKTNSNTTTNNAIPASIPSTLTSPKTNSNITKNNAIPSNISSHLTSPQISPTKSKTNNNTSTFYTDKFAQLNTSTAASSFPSTASDSANIKTNDIAQITTAKPNMTTKTNSLQSIPSFNITISNENDKLTDLNSNAKPSNTNTKNNKPENPTKHENTNANATRANHTTTTNFAQPNPATKANNSLLNSVTKDKTNTNNPITNINIKEPSNNFLTNNITTSAEIALDSTSTNPPISNTPSYNAASAPLQTAADEGFVANYFHKSRLAHLSNWRQTFQDEITAYLLSVFKEPENHVEPDPDSAGSVTYTYDEGSQVEPDSGPRVVLHVDMDCFFASVGIRSRPHLFQSAVVIAHSNSSNASTSSVASCNYVARKYGIRNGSIVGKAKQLCPDLVVLPYEFDKYEQVSKQMYQVLLKYTKRIQVGSCDEALLELTGEKKKRPLEVAAQIRSEIFNVTGCTASVGIGENILLARLACRKAKPNGQFMLNQSEVEETLADQDVDVLPGLGWKTARKLSDEGIRVCKQLTAKSLEWLQSAFGQKTGKNLYNYCRGFDDRPLKLFQLRKSHGVDVSWGVRFTTEAQAYKFIHTLSSELAQRMESRAAAGRMIVLKLKKRREGAPVNTYKFLGHGIVDELSRSVTLDGYTRNASVIFSECCKLYDQMKVPAEDVRGIGIHVQKLDNEREGDNEQPVAEKKDKGSILPFFKGNKPKTDSKNKDKKDDKIKINTNNTSNINNNSTTRNLDYDNNNINNNNNNTNNINTNNIKSEDGTRTKNKKISYEEMFFGKTDAPPNKKQNSETNTTPSNLHHSIKNNENTSNTNNATEQTKPNTNQRNETTYNNENEDRKSEDEFEFNTDDEEDMLEKNQDILATNQNIIPPEQPKKQKKRIIQDDESEEDVFKTPPRPSRPIVKPSEPNLSTTSNGYMIPSPSQLDTSVLKYLPPEVRHSIEQAYEEKEANKGKAKTKEKPKPVVVKSAKKKLVMSKVTTVSQNIDMEFLAALPEDIRKEVEDQIQKEMEKQATTIPTTKKSSPILPRSPARKSFPLTPSKSSVLREILGHRMEEAWQDFSRFLSENLPSTSHCSALEAQLAQWINERNLEDIALLLRRMRKCATHHTAWIPVFNELLISANRRISENYSNATLSIPHL